MLKPYISSDGTGAELVALGNSNLKWQQTGQLNVALEAGFFKQQNHCKSRILSETHQKLPDRYNIGTISRFLINTGKSGNN